MKLKILAVKENIFKAEGQSERVYYTMTVLLPDGDTAKINSSVKATVGQYAILSLQADKKTGGITVRCTDIA